MKPTKGRFTPAMTLALMSGSNRSLIGPSRCSMGFDARLVDSPKIWNSAVQVEQQQS
jgi:hypothetical protein